VNARASRRLLEALDTDEAPPADLRPAELDRLVTISADVVDTIREVFAGTPVAEDDTLVHAVIGATPNSLSSRSAAVSTG
jgi:hypothetical protein